MLKYRDPVKICARIGLGLFFMMLIWIVLTNVLSAVVMLNNAALLKSGWIVWLVNDIPLYLLGVPVFLLVLRTIHDGPVVARRKTPIGPLRFLALLAFCLGATYIIAAVMNELVTLLQMLVAPGGSAPGGNILDELATEGGILPNLIFGACVPALGEEFVFRYMLRRKMRGCADKTYVVFSGLCFGLFHGNIVQGVYAFVLGMLFAWLYLATSNIWLPVSLHFLVNLIGMVLAPLALESEIAAMLMGLMALTVMVLAVVFFFRYRRHILAAMKPPTEPRWPYKPPKMPRQPSWKQPRWPADPADWQWTDAGWQPVAQPFSAVWPQLGVAAGGAVALPRPAAPAHGYPPYTGYVTGTHWQRPVAPPTTAQGPAVWAAVPVQAGGAHQNTISSPGVPVVGSYPPPPLAVPAPEGYPPVAAPGTGVYPPPQAHAPQAPGAPAVVPAQMPTPAGQPLMQMGVPTAYGVGIGVLAEPPITSARLYIGNLGMLLYTPLAVLLAVITLLSMLVL